MQPGDIRSGYYRDQTLMFATGMSDIEKFFSPNYMPILICLVNQLLVDA
jgi:hypothetical protein